jgi:hypothetical protein
MPRYLIEVSHDPTPLACTKAVQALLRTGSHFLTHADWGCKDGVHKCWMTIELDSRDEAMRVVPPEFRATTLVVELNAFVLDKDGKVHARAIAAHNG